MFLAGPQRPADSAPRPALALTLNHYDPFGGPGGKTSSPSQFLFFAKRFVPFSSVQEPSPPLQPASPVHTSPVAQHPSSEAGFSKRRPRHVPIVIPPNVIDSVLNDRPSSPRPVDPYPQTITRPSPRLTYDFEKEENLTTAKKHRPRHIPIVIPAFAQPKGLFPPTPPSSADNTPRASIRSPHSCKEIFTGMSRPTTSGSRTSTIDLQISTPPENQLYIGRFKQSSSTYLADMNGGSESSLTAEQMVEQDVQSTLKHTRSAESNPQPTVPPPAVAQSPPSTNSTTNLSGLVCNVHKCTGKEPRALVGATTTILGDKLYVFGGRALSRQDPLLTSDLYELDLIRRHWTKVDSKGDRPPPRYFHSVCALGDTKLICYGGMSPATSVPSHAPGSAPQEPAHDSQQSQPEMVVMSDIHIYDAPTRRWTSVATADTPQGRYAHCATVLASSATFTSANAPLSAIHHNPPSAIPNQGTLGVALDGTGGAEMVVVGGQDSANLYIEQISVFNLRSLKWTATSSLGRSCGAYRSVVAPLTSLAASRIGKGRDQEEQVNGASRKSDKAESDSSMLIYSNYNFLDVKLELQVRLADGSLVEKPMTGQFSPPGLRFPNGGVLDNHFVVSGTYLTSSKQEYALWALDLRTSTWARIDAGGGVFSQGSWNRGILWPRRNTFVILGNRKRSLLADYNHRRINFSNICMVELEAFGLYDNPQRAWPTSNFPSISAPVLSSSINLKILNPAGRPLPSAAVELGLMAMNLRDLADMDLIAVGGERVPVNSYLLSNRWGPYFIQLLRESSTSTTSFQNDASSSSDGGTLRQGHLNPSSVTSRNSSITITPSVTTAVSAAASSVTATSYCSVTDPPNPQTIPPSSRPRQLYLPHTLLTLRALVHYLYTSSLPSPAHNLCTPQILCSLLQLARPYRVNGLLEATVERLHQILDGRNAAAVFNAAAMAAGGGRGTGMAFSKEGEGELSEDFAQGGSTMTRFQGGFQARIRPDKSENEDTESEISESGISSSAASESESEYGGGNGGGRVAVGIEEVWAGGISCVVGLQKRGLRGLMEGRRARERGQTMGRNPMTGVAGGMEPNGIVNGNGVGLGIA